MPSFSNKKSLRIVITLGTGTFGASSNNQITLEGYRASVSIDKAGWRQQGTLRAQIYGMSQSDMNAATVLQWKPGYYIKDNSVNVYAIDGEQETLVFAGYIINSWANYQQVPDAYFQIQAQTAYDAALKPVAPRSYNGAIDVASVASAIANSMGKSFENNGVTGVLTDVYLANTDLMQLKTLADNANIDHYVDDTTVAICPRGVARGTQIPEISPSSGLQAYPTFDGLGVTFTCLFNPSIVFGGAVKITSSLKQADGQWIVQSISHQLESEKPGGVWQSTVRGITSGVALGK